METPQAANDQKDDDMKGAINIKAQRDVELEVGGDMVSGDKVTHNITNNYIQAPIEDKAKIQAEAETLFAQLPTDVLPPHRPLPNPSRPVYARNEYFTGREDELLTLATKFKSGEEAIAITGLASIGKTQLAIEFAHLYGHYFAGGVFWINMVQPDVIPDELVLCGVRMNLNGLDALSPGQQVELVQQAWATPLPRLLIFDTCEDEDVFEQYRPKTGNVHILITSRKSEWYNGVETLTLRSFERAESVRLLHHLCDRLTNEEADQLAEELGDLPLPLHLAGSYLKRYRRLPAAKFLQELQSDSLSHRALQHHRGVGSNPSGHEWHVARAFELSYKQLMLDAPAEDAGEETRVTSEVDTIARTLLTHASFFAPGEPIPVELLWRTADEELEDEMLLTDALYRLIDIGLLGKGEPDPDGQELEPPVEMPRLLAQFVQTVIERDMGEEIVGAARNAIEQRLYDEADVHLQAADYHALSQWVIHLQHITDKAISRRDRMTALLCHTLDVHFDNYGEHEKAVKYSLEAVSIAREIFEKEDEDLQLFLFNLGVLHSNLEQYDDAYLRYDEALSIQREVLTEPNQLTANILHNRGLLLYLEDRYEEARIDLENALSIRLATVGEQHDDTRVSLFYLAWNIFYQGDYTMAYNLMAQLLQITEDVFGSDSEESNEIRDNLAEMAE